MRVPRVPGSGGFRRNSGAASTFNSVLRLPQNRQRPESVEVELEAVGGIADIHIAQALSYMKAAGLEIGFIINFGEESLVWKMLIKNPFNPRL